MDYNGLRIINTDEGKVSFQHEKEFLSSTPNKLVVPEGTEYSLQLSDGTNVHLNAGSTLVFRPYSRKTPESLNSPGKVILM